MLLYKAFLFLAFLQTPYKTSTILAWEEIGCRPIKFWEKLISEVILPVYAYMDTVV